MNRTKYKWILPLIVVVTASINIPCLLGQPASNFDIIDSLIVLSAQSTSTDKKLPDSLALFIIEHPAKWLVEQHYIIELNEQKHIVKQDSTPPLLQINIDKLDISYSYISQENDSIARNINMQLTPILRTQTLLPFTQKQYLYSDTLHVSDLPKIENSPYNFTKSKLPEKKSTVFQKYIEPTIFTVVAIITVVLLFSVRSK